MSESRTTNTTTSTYKPMSNERRLKHNAYQRRYRHSNPAKVKAWQMNYYRRCVERAERADAGSAGGDGHVD